jgi:hypothetical protein
MTETQERFLRAIAERIPAASVTEVHLFPAIRQGGVETGIAVIAAELEEAPEVEVARALEVAPELEVAPAPESSARDVSSSDEHPEFDELADAGVASGRPTSPMRHTVWSARYRHTLKGLDRGKWEVEVIAEADAPLVTVDAVVRGVQRRAGDAGEPERLGADAFRALLNEPTWPATAR